MQVAIEYHVSAAGRSRIDVLLAGNDGRQDHGIVLELKAWSEADVSDVPELVWSPYGGGRLAQHPCLQARKYKGMILRFNADIRDKGVDIHSAAYLFNLERRHPEPLEDPRYRHIIDESRLFLADDADALSRYIEKYVRHRSRHDVLFLLEKGRVIPSPALVERVAQMLDGNEEFDLIDAQNEAFQVIRHAIAGVATATKRQVFIVHGGPGTGKSVIAVRLVAEVLASKRLGFFIAPNKAFRDTLVEQLARGSRDYREDGQALFQSSWSFHGADFMKDRLHEVLVVDEAHRLKDEAYQYRGSSMVEDMVRAARISVFFLDETQCVQWNDSGSEQRIRDAAKKFRAHVHPPFSLTAQFRCGGSDGYLNWLDDVLQIRPTGNFDNWADELYGFRVFDDAADLYRELRARNADNKARLVAGYSWDWPTEGRQRRGHVKHVTVDGLSLPWNFSGENWATATDGIDQVGCVHTCQGVEFDWLGVLIGPDLRCENGRVVGDPARRARTDSSLKGWKTALRNAKDDAAATEQVLAKVQAIIKNTYKVLLSRGRKGCFVWCADPGLRDYLRDRLQLASRTFASRAGTLASRPPAPPTAMVASPPGRRFIDWVPVYELSAAAGDFGPSSPAERLGWVESPPGLRTDERHFATRVRGRSMEPLIPDGSLCLFRSDVTGSRAGRILLVQHHSISDPELGGSYTDKKYRSLKVQDVDAGDDASWSHSAIQLVPLNPEFQTIWINPDQVEDLRVVAEFVRVLR
ncbi:MAG: DNA/RNA helicase domain-containing protein [Planctomycetaceae bacterium]